MPLGARLALAASMTATVGLLLFFLFFIGQWVSDRTAGMDLHQKERGLIFFLAYVVSVPIALLPAWLGWQYAFFQPRKLAVTCPACQWRGMCRIKDVELVHPTSTGDTAIYYESEFEGIPIPESPTRKRLERLEERRRKQAKRADEEAGPNPDFDFGKGPPR
jgi:hypothetical protein